MHGLLSAAWSASSRHEQLYLVTSSRLNKFNSHYMSYQLNIPRQQHRVHIVLTDAAGYQLSVLGAIVQDQANCMERDYMTIWRG